MWRHKKREKWGRKPLKNRWIIPSFLWRHMADFWDTLSHYKKTPKVVPTAALSDTQQMVGMPLPKTGAIRYHARFYIYKLTYISTYLDLYFSNALLFSRMASKPIIIHWIRQVLSLTEKSCIASYFRQFQRSILK